MLEFDAALADGSRQVGPLNLVRNRASGADASIEPTAPDLLAKPFDLVQYENVLRCGVGER